MPYTEPLPRFSMTRTPPLQAPFFSDYLTVSANDTQQLGNENGKCQENGSPGFCRPDEIYSAFATRPELPLDTGVLETDFSLTNSQSQSSPSGDSTETTTELTEIWTATSIETVDCDFEGCGRACRDRNALKWVDSTKAIPFC
jgi:hypothetical protein